MDQFAKSDHFSLVAFFGHLLTEKWLGYVLHTLSVTRASQALHALGESVCWPKTREAWTTRIPYKAQDVNFH